MSIYSIFLAFGLTLLALTVSLVAADVDTPLHQACRTNDIKQVTQLLSDEAFMSENLNKRGGGGQSPLMAAVLSGSDDVVAYLLSVNADPSIAEKDGYTPMHGAGFQGRAKIAKMLIDHGIDPSDRHVDGFTPIHRASWGMEKRHRDTVEVFLEHSVSLTEPSRDGATIEQMTRNSATKQLIKSWKSKGKPIKKVAEPTSIDPSNEL